MRRTKQPAEEGFSQSTMQTSHSVDALLAAYVPASRSDALMVAAGFSPRKSAALTPRRVATLETDTVHSQASLRDAPEFPTLFRGLKPTTFTLSLRDRRNGVLTIDSAGGLVLQVYAQTTAH